MKNISHSVKKLFSLLMIVSLCFAFSITQVSATESANGDTGIINKSAATIVPEKNKDAENKADSLIGVRKVNVSTSYEWSPFKRVSDNITTGPSGGSISCTKSESFSVAVAGNIQGLGFSLSASVSSSIGYTLNVPANATKYMGYRAYYKVERGTREEYNIANGSVVNRNSYTIKTPQYGEYKLLP